MYIHLGAIAVKLSSGVYDYGHIRESVGARQRFTIRHVLEEKGQAIGNPYSCRGATGRAAGRHECSIRSAQVNFHQRCTWSAPCQSHLDQAGAAGRWDGIGSGAEEREGIVRAGGVSTEIARRRSGRGQMAGETASKGLAGRSQLVADPAQRE